MRLPDVPRRKNCPYTDLLPQDAFTLGATTNRLRDRVELLAGVVPPEALGNLDRVKRRGVLARLGERAGKPRPRLSEPFLRFKPEVDGSPVSRDGGRLIAAVSRVTASQNQASPSQGPAMLRARSRARRPSNDAYRVAPCRAGTLRWRLVRCPLQASPSIASGVRSPSEFHGVDHQDLIAGTPSL